MTDITINIKSSSENSEPKVTTTIDNIMTADPKTESPQVETSKRETKEETTTEKESPKKDDAKKMDWPEAEHSKRGPEK